MKKIILIPLLAVLLVSSDAIGQVKLGLKLSPILVDNRSTDTTEDLITLSTETNTLALSFGLVVDKFITDSYSFSTGLIYVPKRLHIRQVDESQTMTVPDIEEEYRTQYLQIPLSFKLYTNEVAPAVKVYFQIGGGLEVLVFDEPVDQGTLVNDFNLFDVAVLLGAGVEYNLGATNILFGGLSYNRGLIDTIDRGFEVRNTVFSLDFGIKF